MCLNFPLLYAEKVRVVKGGDVEIHLLKNSPIRYERVYDQGKFVDYLME